MEGGRILDPPPQRTCDASNEVNYIVGISQLKAAAKIPFLVVVQSACTCLALPLSSWQLPYLAPALLTSHNVVAIPNR